MKIVLDTNTKQTICPPEFFENVRKINDASELTGSKKKVTLEDYLQKIISECSQVIINKSETTKRRSRSSKKIGNATVGSLVIEPTK